MPLRRGLLRCASALSLWTTIACHAPSPVLIGDAYVRIPGEASIIDVVRLALDSLSLPDGQKPGIERWRERDDATIDHISQQAATFAATRGLVGVVGHAGSRDALLAASIYNAEGVPQIVPNATSRRLGEAGIWTFPMVPNDADEGEFLAAYAVDSTHAERIAVWYVGDEYGIGLRDGVSAGLRARRRALVDEVLIPEEACETDYGRETLRMIALAGLRRQRPDVVILALGTLNAACIIRIVRAEQADIWILGADGVPPADVSLRNLTPAETDRVRCVIFARSGETALSGTFDARARRLLHREPTPTEALTYDGFMLLATAVREAGPNRSAIRRWIESLGRTRPPWPGVTGPIAFAAPRIDMLRMQPADRRAK